MEKTTKKKSKKAARLRRRIGMFVVAGLSLVLTISMAVGSTLAWFAGSTWASKDLYLGGPVYLEMSGKDGDFKKSGSGNLDIQLSGRNSGTHTNYNGAENDKNLTNNGGSVMLPGQRVHIYSNARIFSTGTTDTVKDSTIINNSTGANNSNVGNSTGTASYQDNVGRVTTSTTSVLRARYSLNVEFDPASGYGNITTDAYQANYPEQNQTSWTYETPTFSSVTYSEEEDETNRVTSFELATSGGDYSNALISTTTGTVAYDTIQIPCVAKVASDDPSLNTTWTGFKTCTGGDGQTYVFAKENDTTPITCYMTANISRRDAVSSSTFTNDLISTYDTLGTDENEPTITRGLEVEADKTAKLLGRDATTTPANAKMTSIYKWKYVSKAEYLTYGTYASGHYGDITYWKPGKANMLGSIGISKIGLDGTITANGYAVFILTEDDGKTLVSGYTDPNPPSPATDTTRYAESDSFYKARCNAYLNSYVEYYENEYGSLVDRNISASLAALDSSLNNQFVKLINESSLKIQKDAAAATDPGLGWNAQWLYIDTMAGNDTNSGEISTSVGGWFYLVATDDEQADTNYYYGTNGDNNGWTKDAEVLYDETKQCYYVSVTPPEGSSDPNAGKMFIYSKYLGKDAAGNQYNTNLKSGTIPNSGNPAKKYSINYKDINLDGALDEGEYFTVLQKASTETTNANGSKTVTNDYHARLSNLLYEVVPDFAADTTVSTIDNNGKQVYKVVSETIPFVNGAFVLPGDEITNVFANARISIQVSFQAVQAFLPYTTDIDGITDATLDSRLGTEKTLTIQNAIYIFNEAFDYSEGGSGFNDSEL